MKMFCLLAIVLCIGNVKMASARAQAQQPPPGFPNFPAGFPGGAPDGFPSFPGGSQGGFPGLGGGIPGLPGELPIQNSAALEQLKRQCIANGGQAAYDELLKAITNMQKCVTDMMPNIQTISDKTPGGICKFMHSTLRICLNEFSSKLERCLDKSTSYTSAYSLDVFDSIFKFLCKDDAKHVTTLMMSMAQQNNCLTSLQANAEKCLSETKNLQIDASKPQGLYPNITRSEMCKDMKILSSCMNRKAKDYCTGDMYELATGISNALYEPCSACKIFITNTFLLIALLFLTKLF